MKRILVISTLLLTSVVIGFSHTLTLKAGKMALDKVVLSKTWEMRNVFNILGYDHRILDKTNKVYTYDNLGIVVFEAKKNDVATGNLLEIQFHFSKNDENNVVPTSYFTGNMKIEGLNITGSTGTNSVDAKLKKYLKESGYSAHNYRYEYKGLYIYFLYNETETGIKKVSIGPDRN